MPSSIQGTPVPRMLLAAPSSGSGKTTVVCALLQALKDRGLKVVGAAGEAEQSVFAADLSGPLALVMGGEGGGLRRLTREQCDALVRIPMAGAVESLNVSVAAAVCLYEVPITRVSSGQAGRQVGVRRDRTGNLDTGAVLTRHTRVTLITLITLGALDALLALRASNVCNLSPGH